MAFSFFQAPFELPAWKPFIPTLADLSCDRMIGSFSYRGFCAVHQRGTGALYNGMVALKPLTIGFLTFGRFGFGGPCKMPGRGSGLNRDMQSQAGRPSLQLHG